MYTKLAQENLIENSAELSSFFLDLSQAMEKDNYNRGKGFIVSVKRVGRKNSLAQLRGYWRLIHLVKDWMNSQGNHFTDEQVSDYFKLQAGHYNMYGETKMPRSIALGSKTTAEDMAEIIEQVLEFGKTYNISDCDITPQEREDIREYYNN